MAPVKWSSLRVSPRDLCASLCVVLNLILKGTVVDSSKQRGEIAQRDAEKLVCGLAFEI